MTRLRFVALALLAGARLALAQTEEPTAPPCGSPIYNNQLWFNSKSFCVRTRNFIKRDGGHKLTAAIDGSRYCTDDSKLFDDVRDCHFAGKVRCHRSTGEF